MNNIIVKPKSTVETIISEEKSKFTLSRAVVIRPSSSDNWCGEGCIATDYWHEE